MDDKKPKEELKDRRDVALEEFKLVVANVKHEGSGIVLDVGCGDDYNKKTIEDLGFGWLGLDKIQGSSVLLKGVMEDIPLHDGTITFIYCSHAFEHTINPLKTLSEFNRILSIGRILFLVVPEPNIHQIYTMDKTHNFVLGKDQIISLLQKTGFIVVRTRYFKDDKNYGNIIIVATTIR